MRRNSGLIGTYKEITLDNATGVHDSLDEYNNRLAGAWPRQFTAAVSAVDMKQNESKTATITFTGGIDNGTYYWTLQNLPAAVTTAAVLSATSGSVTVTNGSGTITLTSTLKSTFLTTDQTFTIAIRKGSVTGTIVATSATCYLRGCSVSITVPSSVNEAASPSITFAWSGLATNSGSNYYWTWQTNQSNGSPIQFLYSTSRYSQYTGSITTSSTSNTNSSLVIMPDYIVATGRTFTISLMMNGTVITTSSAITVNDTYTNANSISVSTPSIDEGSSTTISISGLYQYSYITLEIYRSGTFYTSTTLIANSSGSASYGYTSSYSSSTTNQYYSVKVKNYNGSVIKDTSGSQATEYNITPYISSSQISSSYDETGTQVTFTLNGDYLYNKTFSWSISHLGTAAADFAATSGSITWTGSNYNLQIPITILADSTTEGTESFYLNVNWTDPTGTTSSIVQGSVFGLSSSNPITINDTSTAPIVGPGFILNTAAKLSDGNSVNYYNGADYYAGSWLSLFKHPAANSYYIQAGRKGSSDAPVFLVDTQNNTTNSYVQYNGSNQYPSTAGWNYTRPSWNSGGSKAWFWRSDYSRFYEYVPNGTANYGLFDLNSYSSLNYANLYNYYSLHSNSAAGDSIWTGDGTAVWISYIGNVNGTWKVVYQKHTLVSGGTPFNYQHLNSNQSDIVTRTWSGSYQYEGAEFQFNHDGTEIYFRHEAQYGGTISNKIISYTLSTPYDIASGATNNTFDGVTPTQEWVVTKPSYVQYSPGRIKSFAFDTLTYNRIYLLWSADQYSYCGFSVYSVANPEPASAIPVTPPFKLSQATLKNTTTLNFTPKRVINAGDFQSTTGRSLAITQSGGVDLRFYDITVGSTTATLRQTYNQVTGGADPAYHRITGYDPVYYMTGSNGSFSRVQLYGNGYPYSVPTSQWQYSSSTLNLSTASGYYNVGQIGSSWCVFNTSTNQYDLYAAYSDNSGPYSTRLVKWSASNVDGFTGAATWVKDLGYTYYGTSAALEYTTKWRFNNSTGTLVTGIGYSPNGPTLVTFACSTPWVPPRSASAPDPAAVYTLTLPSTSYSIIDFDFDYRTQDGIYILVYDQMDNSNKLLVYQTPVPYYNWSGNQPADSPTVNTLGPLALVDGGNSSSFSVIFDTEDHATQFETVLKGYLDADVQDEPVNQKYSYLHLTYGGRFSTVTWTGSMAGKSSNVTRTSKTVAYNSNGASDITVYTTFNEQGLWYQTNEVNRIGFFFGDYGDNTKVSFDDTNNGIAYTETGIDVLGTALAAAGVGVLDAYGRNKTKWLYYDIYGSNDNGYLDSPDTDYIGMSFTSAGTEPYSWWATNPYNGDQSFLMFTLADGMNATTNAPELPAGGSFILAALTTSSVMQWSPSEFLFEFSTAEKATAFYNSLSGYQYYTIDLGWRSGNYMYNGWYVNNRYTNGPMAVIVSFGNGNSSNYSPGGGSNAIWWTANNMVNSLYQSSATQIIANLNSPDLEYALISKTFQFYDLTISDGYNYYMPIPGTMTDPTAMGSQIAFNASSWNGGQWGPSNGIVGQLGALTQAYPVTTSVYPYYVKYEYGTLYVDFQSYSQKSAMQTALMMGTAISVTLSGGVTTTWTKLSGTGFTWGSWYNGPWGDGLFVSLSGTTTSGTPWPYDGYSEYNPPGITIVGLTLTPPFTMPYTTLVYMNFRDYYPDVRLYFPNGSDGTSFLTWVQNPSNFGNGIKVEAYDSYSGTNSILWIYSYNSVVDYYGDGTVIRFSFGGGWQYSWQQYAGQYGQGSGRLTQI